MNRLSLSVLKGRHSLEVVAHVHYTEELALPCRAGREVAPDSDVQATVYEVLEDVRGRLPEDTSGDWEVELQLRGIHPKEASEAAAAVADWASCPYPAFRRYV